MSKTCQCTLLPVNTARRRGHTAGQGCTPSLPDSQTDTADHSSLTTGHTGLTSSSETQSLTLFPFHGGFEINIVNWSGKPYKVSIHTELHPRAVGVGVGWVRDRGSSKVWFGLLGVNASATARVISRRSQQPRSYQGRSKVLLLPLLLIVRQSCVYKQ